LQFNKALSGENLAPGQYGRGTFDFRFDPEVAVTTGAHYGIRIINMGAGTPVFEYLGRQCSMVIFQLSMARFVL
jgi:hypothetical protein